MNANMELYTSCEGKCDCEESGGLNLSVKNDVDRQAINREMIPKWLEKLSFRNQEDVTRWENEGYRARDILNRLKLEKERGEPIDGHPWPPGRDPRGNSPYPTSARRNAAREGSKNETFDWDLSVR